MYVEKAIEKAVIAHCREALERNGVVSKVSVLTSVRSVMQAKFPTRVEDDQIAAVFRRLIEEGRIDGMFENGKFGVAAVNAKERREEPTVDPRQAGFGFGERKA